MIAGALLVIPLIGALPMAPPSDEPLDASIVDASAFPSVVLDFVVPAPHSAVEITADMVEVDGGPVESVTPVDPATVAVGVVVDDRPDVIADVVMAEQGAAVELMRNLGDGTQVALATPSGLQSAFTPDRSANIARIAGIVTGAPEVVPLPQVIVDTAARLASSGMADRHLVVVIGGPIGLSEAQRGELAGALGSAGVHLHVVAASGVDASEFAALAVDSEGTAPASAPIVASMDRATAAIADRYRVVATLPGAGVHEVRLTVEDERFAAPIDVAPPVQPTSPAPSTTPPATPGAAEPAPPTVTASPPVTRPAAQAQPTPSTLDQPVGEDEASGSAGIIAAGVLTLIALAVVAVWIVVNRRRSGAETAAPVVVEPAPAPAAVPTADLAPPPPAPEPLPAPVPTPPPAPVLEPPPAPVVATQQPPTPPTPASKPSSPGHPPRRREPRRPTRAPSRRTSRLADPPAEDSEPAIVVSDEWLEAGPLRLRPSTGEVWSGNHQVQLSPAEMRVLELFMRSPGDGVSAEAIVAAAQQDDDDEEEEWIDADQLLAQLRRKTGIRGRGPNVRKERVLRYYFEDR